MSRWLKIDHIVCSISSSTFGQNRPTLQRGLSTIAELLVSAWATIRTLPEIFFFGLYRHACVHSWLYTESLLTQCLVNCLWKFHQSYNDFSAFKDDDQLVRFWGHKVRGQGHRETANGRVSTSGGVFLPVCRMHGAVWWNLLRLPITRSRWRLWFPKCTFRAVAFRSMAVTVEYHEVLWTTVQCIPEVTRSEVKVTAKSS